ncbi:AI-2E family transporter [Candidatus Nesciobacter abundans]|uniref:AI-2E family transporter n=1 Tax=Candidatus Nesciobacter abundans TaxID=2601668 RepID=A0A5C0UI97_9PROT|nr:AI-2E family transporter [Candidatus Nesciobacter abundans]QEK39311.1 AI-2E family transporter [Candidatus Nesciobacter abundans]
MTSISYIIIFSYFLNIISFVFLAFIIAYILSPCFDFLMRLGFGRFFSSFIVTFLVFCMLVYSIIILVPKLYIQGIEFVKMFEKYVIYLKEHSWMTNYSSDVYSRIESIFNRKKFLDKVFILVSNYGYDFLNIIFQGFGLTMTIFYILRDWGLWTERILSIFSESKKVIINTLIQDINNSLRSWIYGQMIVTLCLFIFYFIFFNLMNVPFVFFISLLFGLLAILPYVGDMISFCVIVSVLIAGGNLFCQRSIAIFIITFVGFFLENTVLIPSFIGRRTGIHPLFLIISFLVFGKLLGILGVILSVPLSVILAVVLKTWSQKRDKIA